MKALIFNVQKFSLHDGPGVRDLVFFKGCPLRCQWCSNPESQNFSRELAYIESRCIGVHSCGLCIRNCVKGAILALNGKISINRAKCDNCGKCAEVCPAKALKVFGDFVSVEDILKISAEDESFHNRSGGGVTLSGGEPTLQADFIEKLLTSYRDFGIHSAIETCGFSEWSEFEKVCRNVNLLLYDIKLMDSKKHKQFTGRTNEIILENLKNVATVFPNVPIIARTPIIPGFNDRETDISEIAKYLKNIKTVKKYELLEYHRFGEVKYTQLGRIYTFNRLQKVTEEKMKKLKEIANTIVNNRMHIHNF